MSIKRVVVAAFAGLLFAATSVSAAELSPVGRWKTIDDATGKTKSIVAISQEGSKLTGTIVEYFGTMSATSPNCPDGKKNKPFVGLEVVYGMSQQGNEWKGGSHACLLKPQAA